LRRVVEEVLVRVLEQGFAGFASPDKQRCLIEGFKTEDLSTDTKDVLTKRDSGGLRQTERESEWEKRGKPHRAISTSGDDYFHRGTLHGFSRTLTDFKKVLCKSPESTGKVKVSPEAPLAL